MYRRLWKIASLFLVIAAVVTPAMSQQNNGLVAWWKFDKGIGNVAADSVSGSQDIILNNHEWVKGVSGTALKFDGFTTVLEHKPDNVPHLKNHFTIEAWIAMQSYPWNWVAIVDQERKHQAGYFFGIDSEGRLSLQLSVWGNWEICRSQIRLPLMKWTHVVGTYDSVNGISLYVDGKFAGALPVTGQLTPTKNTSLQIGRDFEELPATALVRPYAAFPASYSFDGILDNVKIYNRALSAAEITQAYATDKPLNAPALTPRKWPALPTGSGHFGAAYTDLKLYPEWDALWRVGPYPDVVVSFADAPFHYVFWHGANFGDGMVTGNGIWIGDQSFESHTDHGSGHMTAEHMNDKHDMHTYVSIVENTDARVVLHWRYGLVDVTGQFSNVDPTTGWGDWADEYFYIYPDGTAVRYGTIHGTANHYSFTEPTILLEPGKKAEDYVSLKAVTIANSQGESHTYSWASSLPPFPFPDQPAGANIAVINLKSTYKPFYIYQMGTGLGAYGWPPELRPEYSHFPTWNHWPVNQIPSDGRFALFPDHFSSAAIMSPDTHLAWAEGPSPTRSIYFLFGLTKQSSDALAILDRSWLHPPALTIDGDSFTTKYDPAQRAYILTRKSPLAAPKKTKLELTMSASDSSPAVNPAFVVMNWGNTGVELRINGAELAKNKVRTGLVHRLNGTDLVVWIQYQSTHPFHLTLSTKSDKQSRWDIQ
ncbi:MAG TPA: LamG domain-containing protein [Acidobacteriaceae bacterium]|nr:LamG domain-containing protein [Acidobacteriaceae bacterium]